MESDQVDNNASNKNWDETSFASLLSYDDETQLDNQTSNSTQTHTQEEASNAVEVSELFDDPQESKTITLFYNNPFSKFGAVGLVMLAIFGSAATVLNSIMNRTSEITDVANIRPTKPKLELVSDLKENETGKLKAQLALSSQAKKIKSLEDGKNLRIKKNPKTPENLKNPSIQKKQTTQNNLTYPTPDLRKSENVSYTPIRQRYIRTPVASNQPLQAVVKSSPPLSEPSRTSTQPQIKESVNPTDPIEEWSKINRLGSYGSVKIAAETQTKDTGKTLKGATKYLDYKDTTTPRATLISANPPLQSNSSQLQPLHTEEAAIINSNRVRGSKDFSIAQIDSLKRLTVGTYTTGKLVTPMIWSKSNIEHKSTQKQKFIIRLSQSLNTTTGHVVIPKNSQIIANINDIQAEGLVQMEATRVVIDQKEYILPKGAITILGKSGQALIASKRNKKRGDVVSRDVETFTVGSLAKVGRVLNQPSSEEVFTNSGIGGTSTKSSIRRNRSNVLGAVLEGGFEPLTQQILQRNQRAINKIQQSKEVWYLKAGTDIRVFVNQSFQF